MNRRSYVLAIVKTPSVEYGSFHDSSVAIVARAGTENIKAVQGREVKMVMSPQVARTLIGLLEKALEDRA